MRIAIGADHRGFAHKGALSRLLEGEGHEVVDLGCAGPEACDYPDPAFAVGEAVAGGDCGRGILICGSGLGVCIAANKVVGVRAALCADEESARQTRRHNDSNVLCLGGDVVSAELAGRIVAAWLATGFEGGRHARRVEKIERYERRRRDDAD